MGDDIVMRIVNEKYYPILEKLYKEDLKKFKELFNDTQSSFEAAIKISGGKPTPDIINRKIFLDIMSAVNAVAAIEHYVSTSNDAVTAYLRANSI